MKGVIISAIITGILGIVGSGFVWYTDFIKESAAEMQRASDEAAQAKAANESYIQAIEWLSKDSKYKQRQIYLRDKVYAELDHKHQLLVNERQQVQTNEERECNNLVVSDPVIDRMFELFPTTNDNESNGGLPEGMPRATLVPADSGEFVSRDDLRRTASSLRESNTELQR